MPTAAKADPQVRPVGYSTDESNSAVVRGQAPEVIPHKPMPVGPGDGTTQFGWRRPDQPVATSAPDGTLPAPLASSPPLPAAGSGYPMVNRPPVGAPVGGPVVVSPGVAGPGGASLFAAGCGCGACAAGSCPTCGMGGGCSTCGLGCADGCGNCCNFGNRAWVSAEYLLWWMKGDRTPPLVTAGNPLANPTNPTVLGAPTTSILFGGHELGTNAFSGVRIGGGYWLNDEHTLGIDVNAFLLGPQTTRYTASSTGIPALGRSFIDERPTVMTMNAAGAVVTMPNPLFGQENAQQVALPGVLAGSVSVQRKSTLWGGDANLRSNIWCAGDCWLDAFVGYRMVGLDESLSLTESLVTLGSTAGPAGTSILLNDRFSTSNRFYGAQVGMAGEYRWGRFSLDGRVSLAMGDTQEVVNISGSTRTVTPAGAVSTASGGLLAQPSNIGHYSRDTFGVIPEVGLTLGYNVTPGLRLFVGYNLLYWNNVVRPGEQVDRRVNFSSPFTGTTTGGPNLPAFPFTNSDFWAQGVTFGMEYRW